MSFDFFQGENVLSHSNMKTKSIMNAYRVITCSSGVLSLKNTRACGRSVLKRVSGQLILLVGTGVPSGRLRKVS